MTRPKKISIAVLGIVAVSVLALVVFRQSILLWLFLNSMEYEAKKQQWVGCPINLPDTSYQVTFLEKSIHPFLAEYDYMVRFRVSNMPEAERQLPTNTGGRTEMNVYWYPPHEGAGPYVRLQDKDGEYLVDFQRIRARQILRMRDATYVGDLVGGKYGYDRSELDGVVTVYVGDKKAEKVTEGYVTDPGLYIGRIDGQSSPIRFVPAAEAPEKAITLRRLF